MRALWLIRSNLTRHPGGDTTQILTTAAALRGLGVEVILTAEPRPDFHGFDVVHLFHLDRLWENEFHARRLRSAGMPMVLSTIWWPMDEFDRRARHGLQGRLARLVGTGLYQSLRLTQRAALYCAAARSWRSFHPRQLRFAAAARFLLESASVILPNSRAEQEQIERRFSVHRPAVVVPNAVDPRRFADAAASPQPRSGVLCVGRIEPRKNQLALIEAMRGIDAPLTVVGGAGRFSRAYEARCRAAAGPGARFLGHRGADELQDLYRRASVHACVSWYETPGLASLEAAACGCALVVTRGGSTHEYFGEDAHYCEPADAASIRTAIDSALRTGPSASLQSRIKREFTWDAAARATLRGYELATQRNAPEQIG